MSLSSKNSLIGACDGRVLMNAETFLERGDPDGIVALQWGRVLMNAETL